MTNYTILDKNYIVIAKPTPATATGKAVKRPR